MSIVVLVVLAFALLRMLVAVINYLTRNWLKPVSDEHDDFVSVLIPARNEGKNLPALLESLQKQSYNSFEVIIYDDESTDNTREVVLSYSSQDTRFRLIEGKAIPEGWTGKNHACYQLAKVARGKYLLFIDADIKTGHNLINQSISYLKKYQLSLLSIFPVQRMHSFGEKITIPVMNWILVSLLPMFLIRSSKMSSLSAANGQFMLFDAAIYRKNQFHEKHRFDKVEDIHIMQTMKKKGQKVHTLLGNDQVECRMYHSFNEAVYGFSKNVIAYFGNNYLLAIFFLIITTFGWIPFILSGDISLLIIYIAVLTTTRFFVSVSSKQNTIQSVLLMPLQQLSLILIVIQAIKNKLSDSYTWKGRTINT